ncbi:MAG: cell division protein FtsL [Candidatus Protistobacter heckmanni]|nr:cell division protein FtsL [Candidatus Protistobacter heckmanni]
MNRLAFLLLVILILCSLSLVDAQHRARVKFVDLERAQGEQRQLETGWSQLQYEQSTLAKSSRITDAARSQLGMSVIAPSRTQYLQDPGAPAAAAGAAAPAATGAGA